MNERPLLDGFEPPHPPPGLRDAALRAGRAALSAAPTPDSWTALFTSRGLRVAWLTAVLLLTAANALVPPDRSHPPEPDRRLDPEVAEIGRLPGLDGPDLPSLGKDSLEGDRL